MALTLAATFDVLVREPVRDIPAVYSWYYKDSNAALVRVKCADGYVSPEIKSTRRQRTCALSGMLICGLLIHDSCRCLFALALLLRRLVLAVLASSSCRQKRIPASNILHLRGWSCAIKIEIAKSVNTHLVAVRFRILYFAIRSR